MTVTVMEARPINSGAIRLKFVAATCPEYTSIFAIGSPAIQSESGPMRVAFRQTVSKDGKCVLTKSSIR